MTEGGLKAVLAAMRFGKNDPTIRAFLEKYDSIPSGDRERLPWEAIAMSAQIDVNALLGSAMLALTAQCANISKIIAVTAHPKIMKKRVEFAELPGGVKDRDQLDILVGAVSSPKGPTFIGKAIFGGGNGSSDEDDEEQTVTQAMFTDDDAGFDYLFPSSKAMQDKLVPIRQKLLDK